MLGNCARCGAIIYVNAGRRNNTICPDCKKKAQIEAAQNSQAYRWRCHVREAEARLNRDAAEARRLGMSYGNYMAAIHDGRIKRSGGGTEP